MKLGTAVAALGTQNIAGKTFRVNAYHYIFFPFDVAFDNGYVHKLIAGIGIGADCKISETRGNVRTGTPGNEFVMGGTVSDKI